MTTNVGGQIDVRLVVDEQLGIIGGSQSGGVLGGRPSGPGFLPGADVAASTETVRQFRDMHQYQKQLSEESKKTNPTLSEIAKLTGIGAAASLGAVGVIESLVRNSKVTNALMEMTLGVIGSTIDTILAPLLVSISPMIAQLVPVMTESALLLSELTSAGLASIAPTISTLSTGIAELRSLIKSLPDMLSAAPEAIKGAVQEVNKAVENAFISGYESASIIPVDQKVRVQLPDPLNPGKTQWGYMNASDYRAMQPKGVYTGGVFGDDEGQPTQASSIPDPDNYMPGYSTQNSYNNVTVHQTITITTPDGETKKVALDVEGVREELRDSISRIWDEIARIRR